jgi:DNA-directed RNA polymerase sigma subunit (sigma70/sigma32)
MGEREASALRMQYGLGGGHPMTHREAGERLGLTRERVRQIAKGAPSELADQLGA